MIISPKNVIGEYQVLLYSLVISILISGLVHLVRHPGPLDRAVDGGDAAAAEEDAENRGAEPLGAVGGGEDPAIGQQSARTDPTGSWNLQVMLRK